MSYSKLTNKVMLAHESNYTKGRSGKKICKITPHHMATVWSAERCAESFQNPSRNASANYCIGNDGKIVCNVEEENRAWTSSSGENDNQAITIEVSNSTGAPEWKISDAAWNSLVNLCIDICKRYNFTLTFNGTPSGSLTMHKMFANTNCPGPYLESKFPELAKVVNQKLGAKPEQPKPQPAKKTNDVVADEVIAGTWGNGDERRQRLTAAGYNYNVIQAIVNQKYGAKPSQPQPAKKPNDVIADEVINGKWGNGEERRTRLTEAGYDYATIQAIVNEKYEPKPQPAKKTNDVVADEVIAGTWGNGDERRQRLTAAGYNYNVIQAIVNQKYGAKPSQPQPAKKSVEQVAREIVNRPDYGGWGTGITRRQKLIAYGGTAFADAVQNRINQIIYGG